MFSAVMHFIRTRFQSELLCIIVVDLKSLRVTVAGSPCGVSDSSFRAEESDAVVLTASITLVTISTY